ncbi:MAG: L,D-transpeptidase family protein [Myxococcota bacterium]|nr:L,D-transpeptidase family protein [Myxococcota bacterium]
MGRLLDHRVAEGDNLVELARRYRVGYIELVAANPGVDPWLPPVGERILIPDAHLIPGQVREGMLVNLSEQRLYWFGPAGTQSFPLGIGREGARTPLGSTRVVRKREAPTWYPPASARREDPSLAAVVPPGPENPLGTHAFYLAWPRYLIHGTNKPYGIGRRVSRGCLRLYPEHIVQLYDQVGVGAPVEVIREPEKLALVRGAVYLEAHPTLEQATQIDETGRFDSLEPPRSLRQRIAALLDGRTDGVDWARVEQAARERRGVPVRVSATILGRIPTLRDQFADRRVPEGVQAR